MRNAYVIVAEKRLKHMKAIRKRCSLARSRARYNVHQRKLLQSKNRGWAYCRAKSLEQFLHYVRTRPNFMRRNFHKQMDRQAGSLYRRFMKAFQHNTMDETFQEWIKYVWHFYDLFLPYFPEIRGMTGMFNFPKIEMPAIGHYIDELQSLGYSPNMIGFDGVILRDSHLMLEIYPIYL
jgi:hypothetical protein